MGQTMRVLQFLVRDQFRRPYTWAGFLLGMGSTLIFTKNILDYAELRREPIQFLEPLFLLLGQPGYFTLLLIGILLSLANTPFFSSATTSCFLRTSRKKWCRGTFLYMAFTIFLFSLTMLITSILLCFSSAYPKNLWSDPVFNAMRHQSDTYRHFGFVIMLPEMLFQALTPMSAFLWASLLFFLYVFFLGSIMYIGNLWKGKWCGCGMALLIHAIGDILIQESFNLNYPIFSLLAYAIPAYRSFSGDFLSLTSSYTSILLFTLLIISCWWVAKKLTGIHDVKVLEENRE